MPDHPSVRTKWWLKILHSQINKEQTLFWSTPLQTSSVGTYWDWRSWWSRAWRSYYETKGNYMNVTLIANHWFQNVPRLEVSGRKSNLKTGTVEQCIGHSLMMVMKFYVNWGNLGYLTTLCLQKKRQKHHKMWKQLKSPWHFVKYFCPPSPPLKKKSSAKHPSCKKNAFSDLAKQPWNPARWAWNYPSETHLFSAIYIRGPTQLHL